MNLIPTLIGTILIIILLVGLWILTSTIKECNKDVDCIPVEPRIGVIYYCENGVCKTKSFGNPASEYCIQQGGTIQIRTMPNESQYGVCVFLDGSECEEWKFYRGECHPGTNFQYKLSCQTNTDCVPATCCHPDACVNKNYQPDCKGIFCTMECRPNTMDCDQGKCVCVENTCQVELL